MIRSTGTSDHSDQSDLDEGFARVVTEVNEKTQKQLEDSESSDSETDLLTQSTKAGKRNPQRLQRAPLTPREKAVSKRKVTTKKTNSRSKDKDKNKDKDKDKDKKTKPRKRALSKVPVVVEISTVSSGSEESATRVLSSSLEESGVSASEKVDDERVERHNNGRRMTSRGTTLGSPLMVDNIQSEDERYVPHDEEEVEDEQDSLSELSDEEIDEYIELAQNKNTGCTLATVYTKDLRKFMRDLAKETSRATRKRYRNRYKTHSSVCPQETQRSKEKDLQDFDEVLQVGRKGGRKKPTERPPDEPPRKWSPVHEFGSTEGAPVGRIICKLCPGKRLFSYVGGSTSNFLGHLRDAHLRCLPNEEKKVLLREKLALAFSKNCLPLSLIDDEDFRSVLDPDIGTICSVTLRKEIIGAQKKVWEEIKKRLKKDPDSSFFITADAWTSSGSKKYINIVICVYDSKMNFEEYMIGLRRLPVGTGDAIAAVINDVITELEIPKERIMGVTTDNGANFVLGANKFLEGRHLVCIAHLLSTIVNDALEDVPGLLKIWAKARATYNAALVFFREKLPPELFMLVLDRLIKPSSPNNTRWSSTYYALYSTLRMYDQIEALKSLIFERNFDSWTPPVTSDNVNPTEAGTKDTEAEGVAKTAMRSEMLSIFRSTDVDARQTLCSLPEELEGLHISDEPPPTREVSIEPSPESAAPPKKRRRSTNQQDKLSSSPSSSSSKSRTTQSTKKTPPPVVATSRPSSGVNLDHVSPSTIRATTLSPQAEAAPRTTPSSSLDTSEAMSDEMTCDFVSLGALGPFPSGPHFSNVASSSLAHELDGLSCSTVTDQPPSSVVHVLPPFQVLSSAKSNSSSSSSSSSPSSLSTWSFQPSSSFQNQQAVLWSETQDTFTSGDCLDQSPSFSAPDPTGGVDKTAATVVKQTKKQFCKTNSAKSRLSGGQGLVSNTSLSIFNAISIKWESKIKDLYPERQGAQRITDLSSSITDDAVLTPTDVQFVTALQEVLGPVQWATDEFIRHENSSLVSLSYVLGEMCREMELVSETEDPAINSIKATLVNSMTNRLLHLTNMPIVERAAFFHPFTAFKADRPTSVWLQELMAIYKQERDRQAQADPQGSHSILPSISSSSSSSSFPSSSSSSSVLHHDRRAFKRRGNTNLPEIPPNTTDEIQNEINEYLRLAAAVVDFAKKDKRVIDNFDPSDFWKRHCERLPILASICRDALVMRSSSVTSERVFSASGRVVSKLRTRLHDDLIFAQTFLLFNHNRLGKNKKRTK